MIWLSWRQHRASLLAFAATIAAFVAYLVPTGVHMRSVFRELRLDQCGVPTHLQCADATRSFLDRVGSMQFVLPLFLAIPVLLGAVWGAPLVAREIEQGTHRLAWTQSVSRRRWLLTKVAFLAIATVVGMGAISWLVQWWLAPIMSTESQRFQPGYFDLMGLAPAAYGLLALALGVVAGSLTRRTVSAIVLTLVLFIGVRVGIVVGVRPHYMTPISTSFDFPRNDRSARPDLLPTAWYVRQETVDRSGRFIGSGVGVEASTRLNTDCPELDRMRLAPPGAGIDDVPAVRRVDPKGLDAMSICADRLGFRIEAEYHPDSRYWRFQVTEAAIMVVLSGGLIAFAAWWVRKRIT